MTKTVNELPGTPSLYKEVLRSDWDAAQATIEQQAREIERLHMDYNEACADAMEVARELAALKAQPSGVVLPEPDFALDSGSTPCYYAETITQYVARLNSSPVSAGDERAAFDTWFARDVWNEGCYGNPDILKRQLWPCWQARAALTASAHSVPDEWIAVGTLARNSREKIVFSPICDLHVFDGMSVYAPAPGKGGAE